ncbi:MAG: hypothetical protein QXQ66_08665 [Candidatus Hadarchaeum sp.]
MKSNCAEERFTRLEELLQALIASHQKLTVLVEQMNGEFLEIRCELRAMAYVLRRVRVVEVPELLNLGLPVVG